MLSGAEREVVLRVLWYTHAIRSHYEDRALSDDERMWKNNGGLFPNFARYNSQKWKDIMGPDDPTVRGRRISRAAMGQARRHFEVSYQEPVDFALELVERVRSAVVAAIERNGPTEDGDYEEEAGARALEEIMSDPAVRKRWAKLAREWCEVDPASFHP
jgi:hypothetical protein